jgi:hypothetical protein
MVSNPASPIPLFELAMVGMDAPFELLKALNVTFSGIPGVTELPPEIAAPVEGSEADEEEGGGGDTQFDPALEPEVEEVVPGESESGASTGDGTQFDPAPAEDNDTGGETQSDEPPKGSEEESPKG